MNYDLSKYNLAFGVIAGVMICSIVTRASDSLYYGFAYDSVLKEEKLYLNDATTGTSTLVKEFTFKTGFFSVGGSFADPTTGKLYWSEPGGIITIYDAATNSITHVQIGADQVALPYVLPGGTNAVVSTVTGSSGNSTTQVGTGTIADSSGTNLISTDSSGATHIGPHSLVTIEQSGKQSLYATDASGNAIPINVTNGSDLLVNGVSVTGSIATNSSGIATNTTNIAINTANITGIQSNGTTYLKTNATGTAASASGTNSMALGGGSIATANNSIAVGSNASATAENSVAIGSSSIASQPNTVSIGSSANQRRLTGLAAGVDSTDAVNVGQFNSGLNQVLQQSMSYTDSQIATVKNNLEHLDTRLDQVGSMSSAMSEMNASGAGVNKDNRLAIGFGVYGSSTAIAVGYQRSLGENVNFTVGGAVTGGQATAGAGIGFGW